MSIAYMNGFSISKHNQQEISIILGINFFHKNRDWDGTKVVK